MLTDDDLTTELRTAFRASTQELTYAGRRRPRRTPQLVVPLAAATAVMGTIGVVALTAGPDAPSAHVAAPQPSASSSPSASHAPTRTVTERIQLAGYTLSFRRQVGSPAPVYAVLGVRRVPEGFRRVTLSGTDAKAWVGQESGQSTLYVRVPTRDGGRLFALRSPQWSERRLVALFTGTPMPVPAVTQ